MREDSGGRYESRIISIGDLVKSVIADREFALVPGPIRSARVTSRPWGEAPNGSAAEGQADKIRWKADIGHGMSACCRKAAVPERTLACVLLARNGLTQLRNSNRILAPRCRWWVPSTASRADLRMSVSPINS